MTTAMPTFLSTANAQRQRIIRLKYHRPLEYDHVDQTFQQGNCRIRTFTVLASSMGGGVVLGQIPAGGTGEQKAWDSPWSRRTASPRWSLGPDPICPCLGLAATAETPCLASAWAYALGTLPPPERRHKIFANGRAWLRQSPFAFILRISCNLSRSLNDRSKRLVHACARNVCQNEYRLMCLGLQLPQGWRCSVLI